MKITLEEELLKLVGEVMRVAREEGMSVASASQVVAFRKLWGRCANEDIEKLIEVLIEVVEVFLRKNPLTALMMKKNWEPKYPPQRHRKRRKRIENKTRREKISI